jgi:hypothetical protein
MIPKIKAAIRPMIKVADEAIQKENISAGKIF